MLAGPGPGLMGLRERRGAVDWPTRILTTRRGGALQPLEVADAGGCPVLTYALVGYAKIHPVTKLFQLIKNRGFLAGGLLLSFAAASFGATLGPNLRSAVLGQPLDLSMQLMLDAGEDPSALCLDADVFYVDKPVDKSLVQLSTEKSGNTQDRLIHVRSIVPVEGPVVTVHMRAGCVQKSTRRYVVLAATRSRANALTADKTLSAAMGLGGVAGDGVLGEEKVRALEVELRKMREELLKNQALLAERDGRIDKALHDRYGKALVYGLAALLAAAVMGLFYHSYRRFIAPATTTGGALGPGFGPTTGFESPTGFGPSIEFGPSTEFGRASRRGTADAPVAATLSQTAAGANESLFDGLKRASRNPPPEVIAPLAARDRPRFSASVPFVHRTVKVSELLDLQQQIDLLISLGKQEQAIALLRRHLVDNVKTSALVYLDLINLHHQTGNEAEFEDLRDDFNRVFRMHVAPFRSFGGVAPGTAAHAAVLLRVQAVWPTRQVFHVLEDALFRDPGNPAEVLTLEEYRELLLLYAVGREIIDMEAGPSGTGPGTRGAELAMLPRSSPRLGLDIDLSRLSGDDARRGNTSPQDVRSGAPKERGVRGNPDRSETQSGLRDLMHTARHKEGERAGAAFISAPMDQPRNSQRPTGLNSLVDFDDYDTGYRPDDLAQPSRV